ncbi:MAG: hypothetical protein ACKO6N_06375 [Myxococcota bacterium]
MSDHHGHGAELGVQPDNDIQPLYISLLAAFFAGLLVVIFVVLHSLFIQVREEALHAKVYSVPNQALLDLHSRELEQLSNYKKLDAEKGIYQLPISRAMELTVQSLNAKRPASAAAPAMMEAAPAEVAPAGEAAPVAAPAGEGSK